jgi:hypothetical protein
MLYEVAPVADVQVSVTCRFPAVALTPVGASSVQAATVELTRFGGRFRYAAFLPAFFTECISSNSIGLL